MFQPHNLCGCFYINLAKTAESCYTYDDLNRVTSRTIKNISDNSVIATESYSYDAAGNVNSQDSAFLYDVNNRLIAINGQAVNYDADGNMLSNGCICCTYDSANRLISASGIAYTYTAEDVRIRALSATEDTSYVYDTNCKLSKLLCKTTNGTTTKYVYGRGLIGEESNSSFKTYHFDSRGSTVAITDASGNITDTFAYDTYGKLLSRTGTSQVIFGYNGRDGVVTDYNGLIYMRARYYSPDMRRFINADILHGEISDSTSLNRYSYVNGNPISYVDPFGLVKERGEEPKTDSYYDDFWEKFKNADGSYSLYDNKRFDSDKIFHEQILAANVSGPSFNIDEGEFGLGSISVDAVTGGWEGEYVDFSLLDFGHAEVSAEINDHHASIGAMASIWSPSLSFTIFGAKIELGFEAGAIGAVADFGATGFKLKGAAAFGFSLGISW